MATKNEWPLLARRPGGLPVVHVTCIVESETGETISRAWASCGGQAAVDMRASGLLALGLQHIDW